MKHIQSYVICATPRSGTTLLCDLLADTGVAGHPDSFFRLQSMRWRAQSLGVSMAEWADEHTFDRAFLNAVLRAGAGETGMFGMRLMWDQVENLSTRLGVLYPGLPSDSARFRAAFGPICFIHLSRKDKIAQSVSRIKAEQTGLWHINADGTERERVQPEHASVYDAGALSEHVAEYTRHDAAWVNWFVQNDIQPVSITYEALADNPQATLAIVLSALGLDATIAETVAPRTATLADRESREWATRFRAENIDQKSAT